MGFSGLNLTWATLHFVGWVEYTLGFVGFLRLRRTNLHFISITPVAGSEPGFDMNPGVALFHRYYGARGFKNNILRR